MCNIIVLCLIIFAALVGSAKYTYVAITKHSGNKRITDIVIAAVLFIIAGNVAAALEIVYTYHQLLNLD